MQRFRPRPRYANVMATIAVFIALGGGAYAAANLPKNSIGASQIKNNSITSPKVKDGSLLKQDFKAGQLPSGQQGPPGPQGLQGPQGSQGSQGPPGPATGPAGGDLAGSYPNPTIRNGAISASKLAPLGTWTSASPGSHCITVGVGFWHSFGSGYADPAYRIDRDGVVHLRGAFACSTAPDALTLFTLPTGLRPLAKEVFPIASSDGSGTFAGGAVIEVDPDGSVTVSGSFDYHFVSLSGIAFDTLN